MSMRKTENNGEAQIACLTSQLKRFFLYYLFGPECLKIDPEECKFFFFFFFFLIREACLQPLLVIAPFIYTVKEFLDFGVTKPDNT